MRKMKNRTRNDIIADILKVCNADSEATKSKIMYKVFLSWSQAIAYTNLLVQNGLLQNDQQNKTFKLTDMGRVWLNAFNKVPVIVETVRGVGQ